MNVLISIFFSFSNAFSIQAFLNVLGISSLSLQQTKTVKKDLGHAYDYKLDDAKKDIENLLDRKGIKQYTIHLDRYDSNAAYLDRDAIKSQAQDYSAKSDYVDRTPYKAKDTKTDYMDKTPYKAKTTTVNYVDKAKSGEFRDMANYESIEEMDRRGFLKALGENIHRYELANGEIKDTEQPQVPLNFGPAGQA